MPAPEDVVASFIAAVEAKEIDTAVSMLTEDISYENVPIGPIVGRDAVGATLRGFLEPTSAVEWKVLRTVTAAGVVVNERIDRFQIGEGWLELPVAGVFEVTPDGLISLWRDYFDMATYTQQLAQLAGAG